MMKKMLLVVKNCGDEVGNTVMKLRESFESKGLKVDVLSREDDLGATSLSSSRSILRKTIVDKDRKEQYDLIYTHDWSIAFPLLVPSKELFEKHYCLFHKVDPAGTESKIFQKMVGNMLGDHLLVKTKELKDKFPKAKLSRDGMVEQ